jgi:multiple sugar transport system substrate-binding protein
MSDIVLRGMTWDHRRAIDPLVSTMPGFRARRSDVDIFWTARPLHGFEFDPVQELAQQFDLIVLDHPFVGDIAATGCLEPLDLLIDAETAASFVGRSLESYRYDGRTWALPIDAACQVAVARPDLISSIGLGVPQTWDEMFELGSAARRHGQWLAVGLKGVHSLMTFFTLCANIGAPCGMSPGEDLFDVATAQAALNALRRLVSYCPPQVVDWNSIALHDALLARNDLVFCPAVYCYATYAEADMPKPLRFHDLPGVAMVSSAGSTIGGTGVGISARSRYREESMDYIRYIAEIATQKNFAAHHGQPARIEAWLDPSIDDRFGGCYSSTLKTMQSTWIRPRYPGYLAFQAAAGQLIELHLRGAVREPELLDKLLRLWNTAQHIVGP